MTSNDLLKQIKDIETKYNENLKEINSCQNQLAELANEKISLEGAFNALKEVYNKLVEEEKSNCDRNEETQSKKCKNTKVDA